MAKKLIIINGTMGVGKTSVCKALYQEFEQSVWLDGDWCWMMHPWRFTPENKEMVIDNIDYLLRNFLKNESFEYVIFGWVIHQEAILEMILDKLSDMTFELYKITLTCSPEVLRTRMLKDGREPQAIDGSIARLICYEPQNTIKIDTSYLTVAEVAREIVEIIK